MLHESKAHAEFQVRAVGHADPHFEEHALALLRAEEEVEAAIGPTAAAIEIVPVDRRPGAGVETPRTRRCERIREIEVETDRREMVAKADVDIRTEPQAIDERRCFHVAAEEQLIWLE